MKKASLVLVTLLLIPAAQAMAQPPQPASPTAGPVSSTAPVPTDKAEFLATLVPAPTFLAGCTSNSQCPPGQLCCYPCGADLDNCTRTCINAVKGRCPLFV